jgi:hypothetical protein
MSALALRWQRETDGTGWTVELPWRTLVYGVVRREVEEVVGVTVHGVGGAWELEVLCLPKRTHDAHGAGAAGVLALAATAWLLGGLVNGAAAGLTTLVAGLLWTDTAREMGMQALERRLRALTIDLGAEVWPDRDADLLPPRRPLS